MRLYEKTEEDVLFKHDFFAPGMKVGSKGVRVVLSGLGRPFRGVYKVKFVQFLASVINTDFVPLFSSQVNNGHYIALSSPLARQGEISSLVLGTSIGRREF